MKKEILLNFISTFLIAGLGFVQNKYFVRYMGIETLGMMKLFTQLLAYLNIIELGLGSASAFALYKPLAEEDHSKVSIVMNTIENIYNKIGLLLMGLGILCVPLIPFFMEVTDFSKAIYFYWILYVFNTALTYLFVKYVILFTANQEFFYVKLVQSSSIVFFKIFQIFCIIKFHSFFIYITLLILDNIVQWLFFRRHYKRKYTYITKVKEKYEGIKNDIKNLLWHKIGGLVVFNTDLILISKFTDLKIVGIYASYQMVFQMLQSIFGVVTSVLSPKVGKYIAEHTKEEAYIHFKRLNILYLFGATFFTYCAYNLMDSFIALWLGKEFILSKFSLRLICINVLIMLFRGNLEVFKSAAGFFDDVKSPILESIINLVVSIGLGIKMGLDGIVMGTIVSNILIVITYKVLLTFNRCFDKGKKEAVKVYVNYGILTFLSFLGSALAIRGVHIVYVPSWFGWIRQAFIVGSISFVITFVIFLFNKDFRESFKYIKKL